MTLKVLTWLLISAFSLLAFYELDAELERKLGRIQALKRNKAAVLAALRVGPGRALELCQRANALTEGRLALQAPDFFAALEDLEREGLVERFEVKECGRLLRYYKLRGFAPDGPSSPRRTGGGS